MRSPARDIIFHLSRIEGQPFGKLGTNLHVSVEPDRSDVLTVTAYDVDSGPNLVTDDLIEQVQIRFRAKSVKDANYPEAYKRISDIMQYLLDNGEQLRVYDTYVNGMGRGEVSIYAAWAKHSGIYSLGRDESERHRVVGIMRALRRTEDA